MDFNFRANIFYYFNKLYRFIACDILLFLV